MQWAGFHLWDGFLLSCFMGQSLFTFLPVGHLFSGPWIIVGDLLFTLKSTVHLNLAAALLPPVCIRLPFAHFAITFPFPPVITPSCVTQHRRATETP